MAGLELGRAADVEHGDAAVEHVTDVGVAVVDHHLDAVAPAALVGVVAFDARPTWSQWLGVAVVLVTVVALSLHERRGDHPAVVVLDPDSRRQPVR